MVAIKDIEIPSDCMECMFCNHIKSNDYGTYGDCVILGDKERMNLLLHQKHSDCPLVEIDENTPHNNVEIFDVKKLNGLFPKNKHDEKTEWTSKTEQK